MEQGFGSDKLRVEHIYKTFAQFQTAATKNGNAGRIQVLEDVSFGVREREIAALIGASGCGKTTLLRIIHGLIPRDSGTVYVDGKPVDRPGYDRGVVFQNAGLLPWRTALKNVEFGLELKNVPPKERTETAMHYIKLVGLEGWEHHHPHQLSGGMQQRVGLARAFAIDPEILLMDEPFGALDAQTRELLQGELLRIYWQTRKTILFVTHDLDEAVYLADHVVVLSTKPGRVREIVEVPIPRPRPDLTTLKGEKVFYETRAHIWESIRAGASEEELPV